MENTSILSMVLAVITPAIVGMIWYGPMLFKKSWMKGIGMTDDKMKSANMPLLMIISSITSFFLAFFLLNFNNSPGQEGEFDNFGHGVWHGLFILVTLVIPVLTSKKLYEQTSWKNLLIDLGYWGVTLALMGGILDAMNHW